MKHIKMKKVIGVNPDEVFSENGKDFYMKNNKSKKSKSWSIRIYVKIKKKYN